ncbi:MerR family transcriptional regulator [Spiroplasma monobiae]|uniref:MerR family transcriptional regulator n=1 Tax=Spiroplasma monobiae MQ-1 TaxID=1336748 RepID=A0A2K9LUG2_SPISQ|nr:MerR family transcriptional regulator [Spiroplasma monobiae]AUM62688.1 MerR family transcriptional regulator [Spiroplasma monobiae MQ-1]
MEKLGVKELSNIFEVSEQTFRFYDSKGLFPFMKREDNNYRYALIDDLQWFKMVFILRNAGMEINNVKEYIDLCMVGDSTIESRFEIIMKQKQLLKNKILSLEEQLDLLTLKETHYKKILETGQVDDWNPINFDEVLREKNIK